MKRLCLAAVLCAGCASPGGAPYTAAASYAKLAPAWPGIRIASARAPASVTVERNITYIRHELRTLQLDLYLPQRNGRARAPGLILVHGGGWKSGARDNMAPLAVRMAMRGYATATISYRLSGEARYPAAIHDVKGALRWMRTGAPRYGIDPERIAVAGGSAGGQIAALVGVTNGQARFDPDPGDAPADVQAVVNIDGLSDFTSPEALKHEDDPAKNPSSAGAWFGGRYAEKPALWREASPITHVRAGLPPMLFISSGEARFSVGRNEMVEQLARLKVPYNVVRFQASPHSFWLFDPWIDPTADAMAGFLDQYLAPKP